MLATVADIDVLDAVGDGDAAVRRSAELSPDVVLMDLNLPGTPGLEASRRIMRQPTPPAVLVLTMVDDDDSVTAALQVGARGYLLKGAVQEEVLAAIRSVAAGGAIFGAGAAERVLAGRQRYNADLTDREAEVLALIAAGHSNLDRRGAQAQSENCAEPCLEGALEAASARPDPGSIPGARARRSLARAS